MIVSREDAGAGASAHSRGSAPTIADLPDDVLLNCLQQLDQEDRFKSAALVCKRWRDACLSPALLRSLTFRTGCRAAMPRLQALLQLLQAHAAHVHVLDCNTEFSMWSLMQVDSEDEAAGLVSSCMHACASAGALRELRFRCCLPSLDMSWLPLCTSLTQLVTRDCLHGCPPEVLDLRHLALTDASFAGPPEQLSLPPTLTALRLEVDDNLPSQVSQLTSLARLHVDSTIGVAAETSVEDVVRHLTGLTHLDLSCSVVPGRLPSALTALRGLRQLAHSCSDAAYWSLNFRLQPGPWLAGVEQLDLPWRTLVGHAAGLREHATSLRHLCCAGLPNNESDDSSDSDQDPVSCWQSFCADFLAVHPPLRRVSIQAYDCDCLAQTFGYLEQCRPDLLLEHIPSDPFPITATFIDAILIDVAHAAAGG